MADDVDEFYLYRSLGVAAYDAVFNWRGGLLEEVGDYNGFYSINYTEGG